MGDKSVYKDYVQNLPMDFSNYGPFYTDKEKDMLEGCDNMIIKTSMKKAIDANDYKLLCMAYPDLEKEITYDEFKTGKMLANTRAYDLAFTDGEVR